MRRTGGLFIGIVVILICPVASFGFDLTWGDSWDNVPLQSILDAEYGAGTINALTDYEGYFPGDADPAYWEDASLDGLIIREIAGHRGWNELGWYTEDLSGPPVLDGINDGIVFDGPSGAGSTVTVQFPFGVTRFGLYLNPNGYKDGGGNAPEPELFYTNRFYNDLGPDGSGADHAPFDGDPQCLIYNITHLNGGVPTYVLAWEDLDYGSPVTPSFDWYATDNDFQDLVIEIQAISPVKTETSSWGGVKALFR